MMIEVGIVTYRKDSGDSLSSVVSEGKSQSRRD
jgi:hypothetical protein